MNNHSDNIIQSGIQSKLYVGEISNKDQGFKNNMYMIQ